LTKLKSISEMISFLTENVSKKFSGIETYAAVAFLIVTASEREMLMKDLAMLV